MKPTLEILIYNKTLKSVILENLSDTELIDIANEFQKESWKEDSIVRVLAKQYFGGDSLAQIMLVPIKILPFITDRLKCCSPHVITIKQ